jgi:acyl-CoA reductase-like NAD-dependent aldehyde dehydrogenase
LIVPWNWPLSILGAKLPQALIAGNTVVIKTSYHAPLAPSLTIKKMVEVLPPGVINLVTGSSDELGEALLTHPLVRKINFTGGIESGRHIMAMAAKTLTPVTLELGGNDPAIILEDADLSQESLQHMAMGTFLTTGQVCMALKRIYVHASRYKELVEGFTSIVSKHLVGNGLNPDVTMGPLNNEDQLRFVQGLVADARQKGATVNEVGQIEDEELFKRGYFHRPTIITDVDPETDVVKKEQFGPVIPILPFERIEDAIRMANDTEYGLCSSVWTVDKERALQISRQLEAGYTYLNAHGPTAQDSRAPFGGFKESGIGRALGFEGVLEFVEYHSISSAPGWLF